ncbi:MAG: hypothetical protein H7281_19105 [Bacteriovorax sp.]|nr:hypothetical protein [Bacteriovorax sp.]
MKNFILILGILMAVPAFADSAKTVVGPFSGKLSVDTAAIDIKKIEVEVTNQFCNFWGTTCAGGPQQNELLPIITTESDDGKTVTIVNEVESELSSLKIGNRFSSCRVTLNIEGLNRAGQSINGSYGLVFVNDKAICASKTAITKLIKDRLATTLSVKDGVSYISIK